MPSALRLFLRSLERRQWQVLAVAWLLTLAFGFWAWTVQWASMGEPHSAADALYNALGLFTLNSGGSMSPLVWQLQVARFLAPAVAAFTAVKTIGLFLTAEVFRFRQRFARRHVVVCGLGRRGLRLALELHRAGHRVLVIERDQSAPLLENCREAQIKVITADATESHALRLARVDSASHVIAVCGADAVNAEIAAQTAALLERRKGPPLHCLVHIVDGQLWRLLREREFDTDTRRGLRLEFFNIFESGARAMLRRFPAFGDADEPPHVLILGLGRLGEQVARRVAWQWHRRRRRGAARMRMTVIDREAEERCSALLQRCPQLADACDLVPHQADVCSPHFERCAFLEPQDGGRPVSIVYVCLQDDTRAFSAALTVHARLRGGAPIVVTLDGDRGLAELLGGSSVPTTEFADIHAFSLLDAACEADLVLRGTHERLARATHDLYVEEQAAAGRDEPANPMAAPWEDLPEDIKESNRGAADHIPVLLAAAEYAVEPLQDWDADLHRFSPVEMETMASLEHRRWMEERAAAGWKFAAGERDAARKTSPYLVEWDVLPDDVKQYDRATVARVPTLLADVGLQVQKTGTARPS